MKNLLNTLKIGDKVTVSVLNPESDMGYPVVSLRRFMGDSSWERLKELQKAQKQIPVTVTEVTRGGYVVVTAEGVSGFLPHSQMAHSDVSETMLSKKLQVFVLELQRTANKVIFSQKEVLDTAEFAKVIGQLKVGRKSAGNGGTYYLFWDVCGADCGRKKDGWVGTYFRNLMGQSY